MAHRTREQPLRVQIVVYDLVSPRSAFSGAHETERRGPDRTDACPSTAQLPPSRLGTLLNWFGTGVYHSSVQLAIPLGPTDRDPTPSEFAFGGHDSPGSTGIFSIPAGTAAQRMPGLRYYTTVDLGEAFGKDWERAVRGGGHDSASVGPRVPPATVTPRTAADTPPSAEAWSTNASVLGGDRPYGTALSALNARSTEQLASQVSSPSDDEDDGGESDGTQYMSRAERRAYRVIQEMKRDPEWNGTKYRLLERSACLLAFRSQSARLMELDPLLVQKLQHIHTRARLEIDWPESASLAQPRCLGAPVLFSCPAPLRTEN